MKTYTIMCAISFLLMFSCNKDEMDKTIFIRDDEDYNLPAYTEWGYNSFGAKYENDYFLVSGKFTPCKITYSNNQLQFLLHGTIGYDKEMKLLFIFPSTQMSDYADLAELHNKVIDLSTNDCTVKIDETTLLELEGILHFKRIQLLSIDDVQDRAILSGTFELNFTRNGSHETISNGRFDLGINDHVFYSQ